MTDAKEVGVGNPAEETCCHPNATKLLDQSGIVNPQEAIFWIFLPLIDD